MSVVEVKDIELPSGMQRAMARQAEAERERRAKVVHALGEYEAPERLSEAANVIGAHPAALQLRYLQTLSGIATDRSSFIIFPIPIELLRPFTFVDGHSATSDEERERSGEQQAA